MKIQRHQNQGFTLIELLVVISIIALLATVATPMMNKARQTARMVPATNNAKSILTALTLYAGEYGGLYPEAEESSNDAFRKLFEAHCDDEKMFHQLGDRVFCDPVNPPDQDIGEADGDPFGAALEAGENHWAYVSGLTDGNRSNTPIIADGFTDGIGQYDEKDHVWAKGKKAIVGYINGAAAAEKLVNGIVRGPDKTGTLFEGEEIAEDDRVEIFNPLER